MTARTLCPGSGQAPLPATGAGQPYPRCPACGREFGAQGRKAYARLAARSRTGTPRHFGGAR